MTGDSAGAETEYDQTVQLDPTDAEAHYEFGVLLVGRQRYEAAVEQFQLAVDNEPYFARPYFPLALLRETEGKDSVAIAAYQRFIQIAPANLNAQVEEARRHVAAVQSH